MADMLDLPFLDRAFDSVACDPMYDPRSRSGASCSGSRRRLLFKAPWIRRAHGWVLAEAVLLASHTCANAAMLSALDRDFGQAPLSQENP